MPAARLKETSVDSRMNVNFIGACKLRTCSSMYLVCFAAFAADFAL